MSSNITPNDLAALADELFALTQGTLFASAAADLVYRSAAFGGGGGRQTLEIRERELHIPDAADV